MMEEWKGERRGGVIAANPKRQERRQVAPPRLGMSTAR
jgi:hypothetical protein